MSILLETAFIFFMGSVIGWVLELFFRRINNPEGKWINPGFCTGPYLPIYGFGLSALYLLSLVPLPFLPGQRVLEALVRIAAMGLCVTLLEFFSGLICLKVFNVRLWDYRNQPGNIMGIICPLFTCLWIAMAALYYFAMHPFILKAVRWLAQNLAFSFFIGMFFGILLVDAANSAQLVFKLKKFARDNNVILRYEGIKSDIRRHYAERKEKYRFFKPFRTELPLAEHLKNMREKFEAGRKK